MASTYEKISSTTLASNQSSITLSSIPGTYTDIRLIINGVTSAYQGYFYRVNGDTGNNYSATNIQGDGSSASSGRAANQPGQYLGVLLSTTNSTCTIDLMNYSNTNVYKTTLVSSNVPDQTRLDSVTLWRSLSAITSITLTPDSSGTIQTGTTFTIYGIKAA